MLKYIETSTTNNLLSSPLIDSIIHTKQALEILDKKAAVATTLFLNVNEKKYFEIASNAYQAAVELLDRMKVNLLNQDTKYFIASNATVLYNAYIEFLTDQYLKSGYEELIATIYMIAERNKSTIAFDELQYKYELENAKIPDELKKVT